MPTHTDINELTLVNAGDPQDCPDTALVSAAPTLLVLSDDDFGRAIAVDRPQLTLGRSPRADVCISDHEVSRRHVMLRLSADGLTCVDLGSTNGTFVNGARISRHTLCEGDLIRIGGTVLKCTHTG